jgi:hypothetical protein
LGPAALLGAILAVGLGLRLWGISFAAGTPVGRPDEDIFAVGALHMFGRAYDRLDTGWPDGFYRLFHAVLWLEHAWYRLRLGQEVNLGCLLAVNSLAVYLPVRVTSALLGTATAWVVARLAAELAPERPGAAPWAAALYAVNYLVGRDGHFAVSDALLCFEISLALLCCARAVARDPRWLVAGAFFAGTAFSTKYAAIGLVFPCAAAAVEIFRREPPRGRRAAALAAAAGLAGVLLVSPDIATHAATFRAGLVGHFSRYNPLGTPPGAIFYPATVLPAAFGWAGFLLCLGGLVLCLRAGRGVFLAVYVFMFYACVLGPVHAIFVRYASPLVPALAAVGGVACAWLQQRLAVRLPVALAIGAVALAMLGPPAARLVAFDRLLARVDTRDLAGAWLVAQGPGKVVVTEGVYGHVHAVDSSVAAVCRQELPDDLWRRRPILAAPTAPLPAAPHERETTVNPRWLPVRLSNAPALAGRGEAEWEHLGFLGAERFVIWEYDQRAAVGDLRAASAPDFLARSRGPRAIGWVAGWTPVERPLDPCWTPAVSFSPGDLEAASWDAADGFLAPFERFGSLDRPGPAISIYANACKPR